MYVFVYGTLMKGYRNHSLLKGKKYIGRGMLKNYEMYQVASFPGIVKKQDGFVMGEIYEIDDETLLRLDKLECEGSMYLRELKPIEMEDGFIEAFVYIWNRSIVGCNKVKEIPWNEKVR